MNSICRIVRVNGEASEYSFDPEKLVVGAPKKLNKGKFARCASNPRLALLRLSREAGEE